MATPTHSEIFQKLKDGSTNNIQRFSPKLRDGSTNTFRDYFKSSQMEAPTHSVLPSKALRWKHQHIQCFLQKL
ncbi:hypothetical protein JTE90_025858 [Oedothorax gibbosus]|uniref:Uncharacterized protein n=1 Tax=Oedothorax gibbosus TaxID=931172 RepID=A0AAV6ULX5_9ARAC|nr:hypothetical protein JTE90_025858 [Oedothorax gibbosus]